MISSQDLLYLGLTFGTVIVTVILIVLGGQIMRVLQDVRKISRNVEEMTVLVERVAQVVFPGIERVAKRADNLEKKVAAFIEKKVDSLTKQADGKDGKNGN